MMMASIGAASSSSFWCHRCNRLIRFRARSPNQDSVLCPDCGSGFVEEIDTPSGSPIHHRFPAAAMYLDPADPVATPGREGSVSSSRFRRGSRRGGGDRSPFNPVIVLRGPPDAANDVAPANFELFYDDGVGSGLRPLPASMSEFLMGSGFDRLLDQLTQLEINGVGRLDHPPASKAAIDSMPVIKILDNHVFTESHCAVCKEAFVLDSEAREMPCKHIYHSDCILPWLSLRNSCPVCRHELPTDANLGGNVRGSSPDSDEETVGLTIWRLPGGGFAVGRFTGGRRAMEREQLPVVFTEMDGGFNAAGGGGGSGSGPGAPRRVAWAPSGRRSREGRGGGFRRAFRSFFSFFGRIGGRSHSQNDSSLSRRSMSGAVLERSSRRRQSEAWLEDDSRW